MNDIRTIKYRSGFEKKIGQQLVVLKIDQHYEEFKIPFIQPEKKRHYLPDFCLFNPYSGSQIFIEVKGEFKQADRDKHLWIKEQSPHLDIRFVFGNSKGKLYKGSKTTYGDWCKKHGLLYADKRIPWGWFRELNLIL